MSFSTITTLGGSGGTEITSPKISERVGTPTVRTSYYASTLNTVQLAGTVLCGAVNMNGLNTPLAGWLTYTGGGGGGGGSTRPTTGMIYPRGQG